MRPGIARLRDRAEAGRRLGERLASLAPLRPVVVGLPRGGVPVAAEIARALGASLDVLLVSKVGHPANPEYGLGAVAEEEEPLLDEERLRDAHLTREDLATELEEARARNRLRQRIYRGRHPRVELRDRVVILVDDGVATGGTVEAALRAIRAHRPRRLVLAVGVLPPETRDRLATLVDELVYLHAPPHFGAVGEWYDRFEPVADDEVLALLDRARDRDAVAPNGS
jgi:putative phosphoribosyl transferase